MTNPFGDVGPPDPQPRDQHDRELIITILTETRDEMRKLVETMQAYREDHMTLKARVDSLDADRELERRVKQTITLGFSGVFFTVIGSLLTYAVEHWPH